jgi:hypothetical protein
MLAEQDVHNSDVAGKVFNPKKFVTSGALRASS